MVHTAKQVIWKYEISGPGTFRIDIPTDAVFLDAQLQCDAPMLWALVDPGAPVRTYWFQVVGTGHEFYPNGAKHIGTFQSHSQSLVWHLFVMDGEPL